MERSMPPIEKLNKDPEIERQERVKKILELVSKINESIEILTFPGIHPESYSNMKNDEDEFPGFTTPIDEIMTRCQAEGIKIVLGKNPDSGNVYVLPAGSNNIEMDSITPYQLNIDHIENEHLKELIELGRK